MTRLQRCVARLGDQRGFGVVEALIALIILVIGLVAVSSLTLASGDQAMVAVWRSQQATAGQLALEAVEQAGYDSATNGVNTYTLGGHDYTVAVTVTDLSPRVRQVQAQVAAVGEVGSRTLTTRLYRPRPLPAADPFGAGGAGGAGGGGDDPPDDDPPDDDPPDDHCPPGKKKKGEC